MRSAEIQPGNDGIIATLKRERFLRYWMMGMFLIYSLLSCIRHWRFFSGSYDLGTFDQIVWHYSHGRVAKSSLLHLSNALGDHFSPILAMISPLYKIFPSPEILFFLQSFAVILGAVPVFRFAERRLGTSAARLWAMAYTLFWGIQSGLEYDFHPDLLAVPMVAFAIDFIDLKKWKSAYLSLALLLTVKENLPPLVVFFGITLLILREWKRGLAWLGIGFAAFWLETAVVIPYCAGTEGYTHWVYKEFGASFSEAVWVILANPWKILEVWCSNPLKITTTLYSFGVCAFLPLLSPLGVLAFPLLAERMLSGFNNAWGMAYHYSALLAPVLFMSGADGLFRLSARLKNQTEGKGVVRRMSLIVLCVAIVTVPIFPLRNLFRWKYYVPRPVEKVGNQALALIPPDAVVLAQDWIVPHLTQRESIYLITKKRVDMDCDYYLACPGLSCWPLKDYGSIGESVQKRLKSGYERIFDQEGWVVLKRKSPAYPYVSRDPGVGRKLQ